LPQNQGEFLSARIGAPCPLTSLDSLLALGSPGVILLREAIAISIAIDELFLIWIASEAEEWIDRLVWIPL
jgi:hypothetical protein